MVAGRPNHPVKLNEIHNTELHDRLEKIQNAATVEEARLAIFDASESLSILGALRHIKDLDLVLEAAQDYFEGRVKVGLEQLAEGLETFGLAEAIRKHPSEFEGLFLKSSKSLVAKDLISLFQPNFSPRGSNRRREENRVLCFWRDWLINVEGGQCIPVTLEKVLIFASGLDRLPPLGFQVPPSLEFLHATGCRRPLPEANTCSVCIRLPIHPTYEDFEHWMNSAIIQAPTFGLA
ncbi:G2/M phase-specific E3 ubiquitin-protein ligase-like [Astyanax mexicanus]|nr:G2/M phase-specific E3 ubiquitin-protein ligase-like [Astyanax mexicanus]KAG9261358.1 G2/M phase-specific E3 ubiquitin-protein ligase-like [Astyanax mexicanus]